MKFEQLMQRMKDIDEGVMPELPVEACGGVMLGAGPMGISSAPKQQDNVTMNLSMNGSGSGGIKDLMNILRNIENNTEPDHDAMHGHQDDNTELFGSDDLSGSNPVEIEVGEEYGNSVEGGSGPGVYGIDAVTQTGDDLASHGGNEVPKVAGGGNPYSVVSEQLVSRLNGMYEEIKRN